VLKQVDLLAEQSGLSYQSKEYSGSKLISYRVAYEKSISTFWKADSEQCLEVSFSLGDKEVEDGTYWSIHDNLDMGYYIVKDVNDKETFIKCDSTKECLSYLYNGANIITAG